MLCDEGCDSRVHIHNLFLFVFGVVFFFNVFDRAHLSLRVTIITIGEKISIFKFLEAFNCTINKIRTLTFVVLVGKPCMAEWL